MRSKRTVVVVATLDTKGEAAAYLRDEIASWGLDTILIDPGVLGRPTVKADISREEVAQAAGTTLAVLIAQSKKGVCIAKQTEGLCNIVRRLWEEGRLDGMLAVGGAIQGHPDGAAAGARAMRQAIDAAVQGVALADKAAEHPELRRALEIWGQ